MTAQHDAITPVQRVSQAEGTRPPRSLVSAGLAVLFGLFERPMAFAQRQLGIKHMAWLFLAPNFLIFAAFTFLPIGLNFLYATSGSDQIILSQRPYVGLANVRDLLNCANYLVPASCKNDLFWRAVFNTMLFVVIQVVAMVGMSLLTALVLNRKIVARAFFRSVFFYPVLLSPVVVALIWKWILQRDGALNALLLGLGLHPTDWLVSGTWAFFWVIVISIWAQMGFFTLIILSGLQAIPRDVYEAAEMDAASPWRAFTRITLPLLMPNLIVVFVLALIRGVQTFDEVYVLTGGGPGSATMLIVQYIYETGFAAQPRLFGLAAAASILLAAILMVLTLLQLHFNRKTFHGT